MKPLWVIMIVMKTMVKKVLKNKMKIGVLKKMKKKEVLNKNN
jgi:hypothetical protein